MFLKPLADSVVYVFS